MEPNDTAPAQFNGWATIEIMGHQQTSGYVQSVAFGSTVMFEVSVPALEPVEQVLDKAMRLNYELVPAGSRIRISREASKQYIGAGSIYRMTAVDETTALARAGQKIEILEKVEAPMIQGSRLGELDDDDIPS
jgi:hypothetical protein